MLLSKGSKIILPPTLLNIESVRSAHSSWLVNVVWHDEPRFKSNQNPEVFRPVLLVPNGKLPIY